MATPAGPTTPPTPSMTSTKDIDQLVTTLRNDPSLRVFLSDDFSPHAHVGAAVHAQRIQPALQDAQRASTVLSASVRQHVIRRKEALLAEVEAVDALEKEVASVSSGVGTLVSAATALSDALDAPYVPMCGAVHRMTNLAAAAGLVRALQRFRQCVGRLKDAGLFPIIGPASATTPRNLPSAAEAVRELDELIGGHATGTGGGMGLGGVSLDKVDGVARDIVAVRKANVEVRKRAAALLKSALAERNQTDVEAAVLTFHALGVLQERISAEIARLSRETQAAVHRSLEASSASTTSSTSSSSSPRTFDADVWSAIDRMLAVIADSCFKVILLQHVLSRKYCPVTHLSLLYDTVASSFIDSVARTLAEQVSILARTRAQRLGAAQVFLVLAEGYPRLRALLKDLAARVSALARVSPIPITNLGVTKLPLIPDHEFIEKAFLGAVVEVETHYFTASLERLTKTVNALFEDGAQPGEMEALTFTKVLAAELSSARSDRQLRRTAISNVATAIRLYASQAEDHAAATVPDEEDEQEKRLAAVAAAAANGKVGEISEWHLSTMYNGMVALYTSASRVLGERENGSGNIPPPIAKEIATLTRLSELLLDGPFSTCRANVRKVLQRMHTEDLEGEASDDGCSVYVLDISAQLSMFADGVIPTLARSSCLGGYTLGLAKWVLDSFTHHAALVFPQSQATKLRLCTDMARIELAVESLCPARLLGRSYHALRALRSCALLPTEELISADDATVKQLRALPPSTFAHLILARSNDARLQHPHRRQDKTPTEYVAWLEKHPESDAWAAVEESLNIYKLQKNSDGPNTPEYDAITSFVPKIRT